MRLDILTLFPEMFAPVFSHSIMGRAIERNLVDIRTRNFRDYAHDRHRTVDDYPYGGGSGMVLKPEPLFEAVEAVLAEWPAGTSMGGAMRRKIVLLTPQGRRFTQEIARDLASLDHLVMVCGRYEGVDERVREHLATDEISIGDYVLSGGELPAMVVAEAVVRLLPGVLGSAESAEDDSFSAGLLQFPQYTRPPDFRGWRVPDILLSGNHEEIARWRHGQALSRTVSKRPDLLPEDALSKREAGPANTIVASDAKEG
ncbi:MAG: tRNA (guanosine(37)-N1)-methyltransferase TrmD [Chloroflexi bacterium]|nr:tRNA (guanosine(37)-N1)-methyltransferase TrmD [Chloroflexota bacterium]